MRVCANPGCTNSLDGYRADAKSCRPPCRTAAWTARAAERPADEATVLLPTSVARTPHSRTQSAVAVTTTTVATPAPPDSDAVALATPAEEARLTDLLARHADLLVEFARSHAPWVATIRNTQPGGARHDHCRSDA